MSSPKIVTFAVFNASTGAPLPSATPTFASYTDETGATVTPPVINNIGNGLFTFTPVFTSGHGIAYMISTGANPTYLSGYLRPEDYNVDNVDVASSTLATASAVASVLSAVASAQTDITLIKKLTKNKWSIITSGPDANKMVFYDDDGVTALLKVALTDQSGVPTTTNPFTRTPTS